MTTRPRILIVEDEEPLSLLLRYNLESEGYEVESAMRGDDAELMLKEHIPDLVLLDWMLPGLSGIELCRRLRQRSDTKTLPIILLTARGEEDERVRGLATGADDYVVKPFSVPELLARVGALLRRVSPNRVSSALEAGDLHLDRSSHRVRRSGRELHLGPTEFRLLEFLMERPGRVFSRAQLLDHDQATAHARTHARAAPSKTREDEIQSAPNAIRDPSDARGGLSDQDVDHPLPMRRTRGLAKHGARVHPPAPKVPERKKASRHNHQRPLQGRVHVHLPRRAP